VYDKSGPPAYGIVFALVDDGRRVVGKTDDASVMGAIEADGFLGAPVALRPDGSFAPSGA